MLRQAFECTDAATLARDLALHRAAQGGRGSQLTVVSYGEERPTCRVSDDDCWSMNRRVEIVYTAK